METKEPQTIEYLIDYKGYSIFQDMENGYYIAFNQNDETVCNEATIKMVRDNIDNISTKTLKEAAKELLKYIEDNNVTDESCDDGGGHSDQWISTDFEALINNVKEAL